MNNTLIRALAAKRDTMRHHWTGGCSGHRNGGWNWCKCPTIPFRRGSATRLDML